MERMGELSRLCIDTGPLIAFLKGRDPGATAVERAVQKLDCFVTTITAYELLFGVARTRRQIGEEALLGTMQSAPLDITAARRAAQIHDELIRHNQDIGIKDVLIAAICLEHRLPLLTMNQRHFGRVPGLVVVTPAEFV
ncbi:MAG: type II toxin-antitoxin system VapC family toxin [Caldilineales bacterium]|nr:type II toxin-antitoxin system VapC family toxin [Caldilineales bacterium]MBX7233661.1 type II toxin-antitoxin system VapC family toxin [Caldilineales bacterium]